MKKNIIMLLVMLITFCPAYPQKQGSDNATSPRTDRVTKDGIISNPSGPIQDEFGRGNVKSVKYADDGTVELVAGDLNVGITAIDHIERCYQFFELHKDIFGLLNPRKELILDRQYSGLAVFVQTHGDVKLEFSQIYVHANLNGDISSIVGRFYPEIRTLSFTPNIIEDQALEIAVAEYKKKFNGREPISQVIDLLFLKDQNSFYLGWRAYISSWCFCIDAADGKIRCSQLGASF